MNDTVTAILQIAQQQVLKDKGSEVSDMGVVIYRRTASIEADHSFLDRPEVLLSIGKRVIEPHHKSIFRVTGRIVKRNVAGSSL
jgi:hypothetical protein